MSDLATLVPEFYQDLRRLAAARLAQEKPGHTLQPTALVNEVYLRFAAGNAPEVADRVHFMALAARSIRQILIDHSRRRSAVRRGGDAQRVPLEGSALQGEDGSLECIDALALAEALETLEVMNPRHARMVEMRFFGGLTNDDIAQEIGISVPTVKRDWQVVRLWLVRMLQ